MAKKTTVVEVEVDVTKLWVTKNERTTIRQEIERYWVGAGGSRVYVPYLKLEGGVIKLGSPYVRTDILLIQLWQLCNVFVQSDGSLDVQVWSGVDLTNGEYAAIEEACRKVYGSIEMKPYVDKHVQFFQEMPWMQLDGLTPMEAVDRLKKMGW